MVAYHNMQILVTDEVVALLEELRGRYRENLTDSIAQQLGKLDIEEILQLFINTDSRDALRAAIARENAAIKEACGGAA